MLRNKVIIFRQSTREQIQNFYKKTSEIGDHDFQIGKENFDCNAQNHGIRLDNSSCHAYIKIQRLVSIIFEPFN